MNWPVNWQVNWPVLWPVIWLTTALVICPAMGSTAGAARAAGPDGPLPADADSIFASELPPDLEEVVGELDAADQPLPRRELVAGAAQALKAGGGTWGSGRVAWRSALVTGGGRQDGRLTVNGARLAGRAALRLRPGSPVALAGGGGLSLGRWRLWGGNLTLRHGYGLAAGDPARRGSLAADQSFGRPAGGLAPRTAAGPGMGGAGAGADVAFGRWQLAALGGPGAAGQAGPGWSVRLARAGLADSWAVFARRDSSTFAVSGCGRLTRATVTVSWELATVRTAGGPGGLAAITALAWQPSALWKAELLSGVTGGAGTGAAAVLPAGARSGWALRLAWRERGRGALELLAQGASQAVDASVARRRSLEVLEAAWERRAVAATTAILRIRRAGRRDTGWDERAPWLPGVVGPPSVRTLVAAGLEWERGSDQLGAHWRSFTVEGSSNNGNRQLLSFAGRRAWGTAWAAWAEAAAAWGDPVDLVRGLTPLPGLVLARHWGSWRSEVVMGTSRTWRSWQVRAALARRLPDAAAATAEDAARPSFEGWIEAQASW